MRTKNVLIGSAAALLAGGVVFGGKTLKSNARRKKTTANLTQERAAAMDFNDEWTVQRETIVFGIFRALPTYNHFGPSPEMRDRHKLMRQLDDVARERIPGADSASQTDN